MIHQPEKQKIELLWLYAEILYWYDVAAKSGHTYGRNASQEVDVRTVQFPAEFPLHS